MKPRLSTMKVAVMILNFDPRADVWRFTFPGSLYTSAFLCASERQSRRLAEGDWGEYKVRLSGVGLGIGEKPGNADSPFPSAFMIITGYVSLTCESKTSLSK